MNIIDKLVAAVAPVWAVKRAAARFTLQEVQRLEQRGYEAAGKGRRQANWKTSSSSADSETAVAIELLRNRSRDMTRNNAYAAKALGGMVSNLVGTGIRPNFVCDDATMLEKVKQYWKDWAEQTEIDFMGNLNFYGQQSLGTRAMLEGGEFYLLKRRLKSKDKFTVPIKLQMLESDHLDRTRSDYNLAGGNYIEHGIEYNADGQVVAYWLFDKHPGSQFNYYMTSTRVPKSEILQVFRPLRIGQQHGIPHGTASMLKLKDFEEYEDAQLVRQKIAACFAVFISGKNDNDLPDANAEVPEQREKLAPGIIERLDNGSTVTFGNPPGVSGYGEYSRKVLQGAAAGYEITYEIMTGDLSNVNFSSYRAGWIEFFKTVTDIQSQVLITKMCNGVFNWFIEALTLVDNIDPKKVRVEWTVPRREMINPIDETKAIIMQMENYLISWSEAVREMGWNPDDLLRQIEKDIKDFEAKKMPPPGMVKATAAPANPPPA